MPATFFRLMVLEGCRGRHNFDACVRGRVGGSRSKGVVASPFGAASMPLSGAAAAPPPAGAPLDQ
jgi:hypothetical protein